MAGQQEIKTPTCAKCGACAPVCPVYQSTGRESHTARGKLHLFGKGGSFDSAYFNDLLAKCIQCGACDAACPRRLTPSAEIRAWRGRQPFGRDPHAFVKLLGTTVLASPRLQEGSSRALRLLHDTLPRASGLRRRLDLLVPGRADQTLLPPPQKAGSKPLAYFPGCLAEHLHTDIKTATAILAGQCGFKLHSPAALTCCGLAVHAAGNHQEARELAKKNIAAFSGDTGADGPILTSCASCSSHLKDYPALFVDEPEMLAQAQAFAARIQEFSTFFAGRAELAGSRPRHPLFYHDPCHLRFGPCRVHTAPRRLLADLNGCPPLDLPSRCCGQGGLFHLTNPELSRALFTRAAAPLAEHSAALVVTTCSGCLLQWQQGLARANTPVKAEHLAVFLAKISRDC
jgi:glycolate oxidase iron-sulfur subunit